MMQGRTQDDADAEAVHESFEVVDRGVPAFRGRSTLEDNR